MLDRWAAMKMTALILIILAVSAMSNAADFKLHTGGGPPGSDQFDVVVKDNTMTVTRSSLPITSKGLTRKTITINLSDQAAKDLQRLADSSTDFGDGCNTPGIVDGTNASLFVSGRAKSNCINAVKWPKGQHTTEFLKVINSNLPASFHVF